MKLHDKEVKFIKEMNEIIKNKSEAYHLYKENMKKRKLKVLNRRTKKSIQKPKTTKDKIIILYDGLLYNFLDVFSLYNKSYKKRWEALSKEYGFPLDNSCIEKEKPVRN